MTAFQIFVEKVKKGVGEYCGEGCIVEVDEIRKNNGIVYHGITVIQKDTNISPTIYIDRLYQEYIDGLPLGQVVERVIALYEKHKVNQKMDMHFLSDFTWMKDRILYKLIGYEKNQELLKEIPHVRFLDMAIVFYCSLLHDALGSVTVLIKNGLCSMWQVEAQELLQLAEKNTPRILPPDILDMKQLVNGAGADILDMYVLTNRQKQFGASCILYTEILQQFSEKAGSDFWILPSSVHEVILVPRREGLSGSDFKEMVREINRTQVAWEEVLTDSVYYYEQANKKIRQL